MSTAKQPAPFNLHEIVADICDTNPTVADPYSLAELVLAKIDSQDYREALHQALSRYLTGYVTQHRPTNHQPGSVGGRTVGRSRLAGVGNLLASREFSPHRGAWILLAEATEADLRSIAAKRGEVAATYLAKEAWYNGVADLLLEHKVTVVGELPVTIKAALAAGTLP
jgi:hypothetical protein